MTGRIGITPEFQKGECSVCKAKNTDVRVIAEPDSFRAAALCKQCGETLTMNVDEVLQKYGKRMKGAPKKSAKNKRKVR